VKSYAKYGANLKLVLIVNGLDSGGAEKSTIKLCESFLSDGHEVTLVTISSLFDFYTLKSSISRTDLGADGSRRRKFPQWTGINRLMHWFDSFNKSVKLRRLIMRVNPDCIISMSAKVAVFTYLSTRFLKYPQIGSERIHPDSKIYSHGVMTDTLRLPRSFSSLS
jgi:UDP-N-acetylglucosamine:LPS N-acetylglucosamine transferase